MGLRVKVCRIRDVPLGEMRAFAVDGIAIPILIANIEGRYLATSSMCPHEDVSLLPGKRVGSRIICPGHGYQFDLETGACAHDGQLKLKRYRVTVLGQELFVDLI